MTVEGFIMLVAIKENSSKQLYMNTRDNTEIWWSRRPTTRFEQDIIEKLLKKIFYILQHWFSGEMKSCRTSHCWNVVSLPAGEVIHPAIQKWSPLPQMIRVTAVPCRRQTVDITTEIYPAVIISYCFYFAIGVRKVKSSKRTLLWRGGIWSNGTQVDVIVGFQISLECCLCSLYCILIAVIGKVVPSNLAMLLPLLNDKRTHKKLTYLTHFSLSVAHHGPVAIQVLKMLKLWQLHPSSLWVSQLVSFELWCFHLLWIQYPICPK